MVYEFIGLKVKEFISLKVERFINLEFRISGFGFRILAFSPSQKRPMASVGSQISIARTDQLFAISSQAYA
ncbi:MAG: hypothetical protein EA393_08710 [Bacteroidetes bacterium]|nr:MAG: hypothetical protein EA393_08710 [Bacteroidota bacterium]